MTSLSFTTFCLCLYDVSLCSEMRSYLPPGYDNHGNCAIFHGNRMECFRSHCHCCRYLLRLVFPQKGAGENVVLVVSEYCLGSQSELLKNRTDSNKQ